LLPRICVVCCGDVDASTPYGTGDRLYTSEEEHNAASSVGVGLCERR
jgi:hypothetical protein